MLVGIFLPLLSFILLITIGPSSRRWAGVLASFSIATSLLLFLAWGIPHFPELSGKRFAWWTWQMLSLPNIPTFGGISGGIQIDEPALLMLGLVGFISLLVHLFSIHYMKDDPGLHRYFAYLGLFTTAMFCLVAATDLITLFFWWEIVGVASFLLIGFWYRKPAAASAAKKAFIVNRVGDVLFLAGICLLIAQGIGVEFTEFETALTGNTLPFYWLPALFLVSGALGKSAQFPLYVWLPDAMQGPTPVSALIHAATMVVAGIFLLFRVSPILGP
ncbi:MAG TPA: hypothetical protein DCP28_13595, partial [Cytophagales bacterium]|nr:hypothetical protein [Cytophagales bacterium]